MTLEFSEQSTVHVEGLLAGWNDASIRTFTPVPDHYCGHPDHTTTWRRGYRAGREAFMTAWEKSTLGSAGFKLALPGDDRYWRLPLRPKSDQPAAYLVDVDGNLLLNVSPATCNSSGQRYAIFSGELRVAVVNGDLLSAMQTAACYAR